MKSLAESYNDIRAGVLRNKNYLLIFCFAVCPGGEEAVLKIVGLKGLVGSNPMHSVYALGVMVST